jgi:hypothetical protein
MGFSGDAPTMGFNNPLAGDPLLRRVYEVFNNQILYSFSINNVSLVESPFAAVG